MARRTLILPLALAFLALLAAPGAMADTITYTFQGNASGSLGGTSFSNAQFTIILTADSDAISQFTMGCGATPCTILDVQAATASFTVHGQTTAITSPIGVFDNQTVDVLGLARITGPGAGGIGMDLLDLTDPAFGTYNLSSELAVMGPFNLGTLNEFSCATGCVITSIGNLTMTTASDVTFSDPVSTPEPSSLLLLACGGLALVGLHRRARAVSRV